MTKIYEWQEIKGYFTEGIILGNGASIAIDPRFSYSSIFENAKASGLITSEIEKVFNHLNSEDFELVLRMLWHTHNINLALEVKDNVTSKVYGDLRSALIKAVRDIHILYDQVIVVLPDIATFLSQFDTVISLNYDFLVYWAILLANDKWNQTWFKDCFIEGKFDSNCEKYREPRHPAEGSTLVFYPHGNLVLANDLYGDELKLIRGEYSNLIDTIMSCWESGKYSPLFVSEGTAEQKLHAIYRSFYLSTVYESILPVLGSNIVIYGWSISKPDKHILDALREGKINKIAFSVLKNRPNIEQKCVEIENKLKYSLNNENIEVLFFYAEGAECWIH